MKTWEEVVYSAKELAKATGRKAVDCKDFAKIKLKMAENDHALDATMEALGRLFYDSRHEDKPLDEEMVGELIAQVEELNASNADLQAQLDAQRGRKTCASCGAVNASDAAYCSKCGSAL